MPNPRTISRRSVLLGATVGASWLVLGGVGATEAISNPRRAADPALAPNPGQALKPAIVSRHAWGADESWRGGVFGYAPIRKLVIHHSDGSSADPAGEVRIAYQYATHHLRLSDIDYNFLIGQDGQVFEGRWARSYPSGVLHNGEDASGRGVIGAHAKRVNAGSCGICMIGNFDRITPTAAALNSLVTVLSWKAQGHGIDPLNADPYIDLNGVKRSFNNIAGHNEVGSSRCPGAHLAKLLPTIRREVASRVGRYPARTSDMRQLATILNP